MEKRCFVLFVLHATLRHTGHLEAGKLCKLVPCFTCSSKNPLRFLLSLLSPPSSRFLRAPLFLPGAPWSWPRELGQLGKCLGQVFPKELRLNVDINLQGSRVRLYVLLKGSGSDPT